MKNSFDFNCPKCGSENIRKFSVIYRDGLSDLSFRNSYGTIQTARSQVTKPPFNPSEFLRLGCFLILAVPFLVLSITHSPFLVISCIILLAICAGICWIYASTIYDDALQRWNSTYLCQRCDSTFILDQHMSDDW